MKSRTPGIFPTALLTIVLAGCGDTPPQQAADDSDDRLRPGEHAASTADDNVIPYSVAGEGDATIVLVHCWMCDRSFWAEQIPILAERYRTIALDLPGHGDATSAREEWTIAGYGEDVARLIEDLGLTRVVLVGHSMGAPVSLRTAAVQGGRVSGIIAVDALHDAEIEFSGEEMQGFMAAFEADFVATCNSFVQRMIPEEGADDVRQYVQTTSCDADRREIALVLMREFGTTDMPRLFSEAGVPIRAINAVGPTPTRIDSNRKYADFDAVLVDDAGHYLQMTRPEAVNPLLLEAIEEILQNP